MSRRPAAVTQADVARAIRAARQAGAAGVEVNPDGTIAFFGTAGTTMTMPQEQSRLLTQADIADRLGLSNGDIAHLVKEGVIAAPIPGTRRWDRVALYNRLSYLDLRTSDVPTGYVYFIEMGDFIKIGWSSWPDTRRASLQISTPYDLKILGAFHTEPERERRVHGVFEHLRKRGEWFRKSRGLLAYLAWLKIVWRHDAGMIPGDLDNVIAMPKAAEP